jgi:molecular chaperone HscB
VICWSCERASPEGGPTCPFCGAILPPDLKADHFAVLGVDRRYDVDLDDLEARYRELTRRLHPDRFAKADPRARRASLQRSVQLNEAWRTLRDPLRRAEYLIAAGGLKVGNDVPPALLMETLELREELAEARAAGDDAKVQAMARAMRQRLHAAMAGVAADLDAGRLESAAERLVAVRYHRRFMDEVAVHDEAVAEAAGADARGAE